MVAAPFSPLGSLSVYDSYDATPHVGTRFPNKTTQLSQILEAPNSDELIKDLATLVSHRGVVFFSEQDLDIEKQKELGTRLGELSGKPATSKLHVHPISEQTPELTADVSVISSEGGIARNGYSKSARASAGWHTDITFESVPSDYAILKLHTLPTVGGDTLVPVMRPTTNSLLLIKDFSKALTAVHDGSGFREVMFWELVLVEDMLTQDPKYAKELGTPINDPRGSPENTGSHLQAVHPVIRTHPVTGFKSLFVNRGFTIRIVELHEDENDIAIWDNRCTFHTATNDYQGLRLGNRVVSIGEKPFFDPASKSRRAVLGL
ncbi:taurine catabolism dioxygenase [Mycena metata]|uniref:Taurine catabolism dioxygenase n=1 Tax=Mycena metata TaxID=1033252 RepID=A0AAD7HPB3_9AGAR|nr:taurine catabolism dioxygenase [Mycena metata]